MVSLLGVVTGLSQVCSRGDGLAACGRHLVAVWGGRHLPDPVLLLLLVVALCLRLAALLAPIDSIGVIAVALRWWGIAGLL